MNFLKKKNTLILALILSGLGAGLMLGEKISPFSFLSLKKTPDIPLDANFLELAKYFQDLSDQKGARAAYEVLESAKLPPNIDFHLLGHVIGDTLYKQEGAKGIRVCSQNFRNACSHSIVIGLLLEKGEAALAEIANACRKAPGGSGAYTMCFHGLGHGVLAYNEYELPRAIDFCKKVGTPEFQFQEFKQCVGGTIMEMIAGVHDRAIWLEKSEKYFKKDDPLYPCTSSFMPKETLFWCYLYLTPHLFELGGANLGLPTEKNFKIAFPFCDALPDTLKAERDACYGGFGKEFVVLAKDRDVRKIDEMSDAELEKVYSWCKLADNKEGTGACILHAMQSLYWGGENNRGVAIRFCRNMNDETDNRSTCFFPLIGVVNQYVSDQSYRQEFCSEIPEEYRFDCNNRLISPSK